MASSQENVTSLLAQVREGVPGSRDMLFSLVYDELRRSAGQLMRIERPEHTLQPTALVNEAIVRLLEGKSLGNADNRVHFYGIATRAMRQILVDYARRRSAKKRRSPERTDAVDLVLDSFQEQRIDVVLLDEALTRLARLNNRQSEIVTLRFFAGLRMKRIAELLDVSLATVENDFRIARAWLRGQLDCRNQ